MTQLPFNTKDNYKVRKTKLLKDTVKFYSEDTTRRSYEAVLDDGIYCGSQCYYLHPNGNTCAIGRYITKYNALLEGRPIRRILQDKELLKCFPKNLTKLGGKFLQRLQNLHDTHRFWTKEGLSEEGKEMVEKTLKDIKKNSI